VIRSTVSSDNARSRFAFEAEVLARLDHPGIAKILEARHEGHRSWFAMEYVDGDPIDEYVEDHALDLGERLELIAKLCDAVHHAHLSGVVHRDLKPANVLVTEAGQPKVLDFGIARATAPDLATGPKHTRAGELIGTPSYMSPEQATLSTREIDGRSDVHTIGVIAYELLSGHRPHDPADKTLADILYLIQKVDPPRLGKWRRELRGDVETIVAKAMEKDAGRRYASAAAMAEDIRRYLNDEPIAARPATLGYHIRKLAKRNPAFMTALGGLALSLFLGTAASTALGLRAVHERNAALLAREAVEERNAELTLTHARAVLHRDATASLAWLATLPDQADWPAALATAWEARRRGVAAHILPGHGHEVRSVAWSFDGKRVATGAYDHLVRVWDLEAGTLQVIGGHEADVEAVAWSPDGQLLSVDEDGVFQLWRDGQVLQRMQGHAREITAAAWAPDGTRFVTGSRDHTVKLWRADGSLEAVIAEQPDEVEFVTFSADGTRIASTDGRDGALVVDLDTGESRQLVGHTAGLDHLAFSPDGTRLATSGNDQTVRLWDPATGEPLAVLPHRQDTRTVAFTPDSATLLTSGRDGRLGIWDLTTLQARWIDAHKGPLRDLEVLDEGRRVATGGDDGDVVVWDLETGAGWRLRGHRGRVHDLAAHGHWLATATADGTARIWDIDPAHGGAYMGHTGAITEVVTPPGQVVSASEDGTLRVVELATGRATVLRGHRDQVETVVAAPDGCLFSGGRDATWRRWDPSTGDVQTFEAPERVDHLAVSPDGQWLVVGTRARIVPVVQLSTGSVRTYEGHTDQLLALAFSPDSSRFATGSADLTARVWSTRSRLAERVEVFDDQVTAVAFGPQGQVAAGAGDGAVRVWRGAKDEAIDLEPHGGSVTDLVFLPDGRLASASLDRGVRLHDPATGAFTDWSGPPGAVLDLEATADGRTLLGAAEDGTLRVWEVATGDSMPWWSADVPLHTLALFPGDASVAVGGDDGLLRIWPVAPETSPEGVRAWLAAASSVRLDADDALTEAWDQR